MKLLKDLCHIFGPSGNEIQVRDYIIDYVQQNKKSWKNQPKIIYGDGFQDCLLLVFGKPRTAVFAHMDSHGFTVRYENQLVPIGDPEVETGTKLVGVDNLSMIECEAVVDEKHLVSYRFGRPIQTGTELVFECDFKETEDYVQSCYLDNRLGVYTALKLAENLQDGILVFSCWEEHGGGSVPFLIKHIYENYQVSQALVADITWITDGVKPGDGVAISLRDRNIPRRSFLNKIITIANHFEVPFQLEVEGGGSSDGRELQLSPYPVDWCFIGAPEENVHSPFEKVMKDDITSMIDLYQLLMKEL